MKKLILTASIIISMICTAKAQLTSNPDGVKEEVFNQVSELSSHQGVIVTSIKLAKDYYMNSTDPAAGNTFQQRRANLLKEVKTMFSEFKTARTSEYQKVSYIFTDQIKCKKSGNDGNLKLCWHTMPINEGCTVMSIVKTENGNMKKWEPSGNTFRYAAGKTSPGTATVDVQIKANYSSEYIKNGLLENDLKTIRAALDALNLPSDLSLS
ncbi:MAG: hypothetical protein JWR72_1186 [Flavisolibacter sp.]|jgi:hypothetical protein|nr:hypothetical protein [Flavisolibacter sp.]